MSFDFNLSSDDDDDEEQNVFGGILDNTDSERNGGDTSVCTPTTTGYILRKTVNDYTIDSDGGSNADENDFDYVDYYDFEDDRKPSSIDASSSAALAFPSDFDNPIPTEESDDEGDIDWEDAGEEEEGVDIETKAPGSTVTPKAVTLEMGDKNDAATEKSASPTKKRKPLNHSISVFRHNKLAGNPELQMLLTELHKTSLLAWACHSECMSRYASNDVSLGMAHSLIPTAWLWTNGDDKNTANGASSSSSSTIIIPTLTDVGHFLRWFMDYVRPLYSSRPSSSFNASTVTPAISAAHIGRRSKRLSSTRSHRRRASSSNKHKSAGSDDSPKNQNAIARYRLEQYCSELAKLNANRQDAGRIRPSSVEPNCDFNGYDALILFLSMVRSMGWRARYVVAVEPISRDLNVDHPLFSTNGMNDNLLVRFFKRVLQGVSGDKETPISLGSDDDDEGDSKPPAATKRSNTLAVAKPSDPKEYPDSLFDKATSVSSSPKHICWVEILCKNATTRNSGSRVAGSKKPPSMQWIHVDPVSGVTNQPGTVEEALFVNDRKSNRNSYKKGSRRPIVYALAVEHLLSPMSKKIEEGQQDLSVRMTDVTPRYASSMVETMEARGVPAERKSSKPKRRKLAHMTNGFANGIMDEERPDEWFSRFLNAISKRNRPSVSKPKKQLGSPKLPRDELKSKGKTKQDAIALDDDDCDGDSESYANENPAAVTSKPQAANSDRDIHHGNHDGFDIDREEESQLQEAAKKEPLPTSKTAFKKHPMYVIRSVLNSTEVLKPDAKKRICGMFKGELVYRRSDVETALSAKRWLYEGRKVRGSELKIPILKVKARRKPATKGFKALKSYGVGESNDGSEASRAKLIQEASEPLGDGKRHLYGRWQTDPWGPIPVDPNDPIPVNEYNNVELELLNPGLVHVELHHVAKVAKRLNLPYAPCLLGFEGNGGNRTPTIRGIVVHEHNEELLREAHAAMAEHLMREEHERKQKAIMLRWKRLLVGVLTKDRLEREYGEGQDEH